jgi:hypothetical protein
LGVTFGGNEAASFTVVSDGSMVAVSPPATGDVSGETVDVRVVGPGATSATRPSDQFEYAPPPPTVTSVTPALGPTGGGTTVTVQGGPFTGATSVLFGSTPGTGLFVANSGQLSVVAPAGATGPVDVQVVTPGGTSPATPADVFTYVSPAPPAPPTGLTVTGLWANSFQVSWDNETTAQAGGLPATNYVLDCTSPLGTCGAGGASRSVTPSVGSTTSAREWSLPAGVRYTVSVSAVNQGGLSGPAATLTVETKTGTLLVTHQTPTATLGVPYQGRVWAGRGTPPYHWTLNGGFPRGLLFHRDGQITGTPNLPGIFRFEVFATDSGHPEKSGMEVETIVVKRPTS